MATFMPNVARRRIIETMREFENLLLDIKFFCFSDENLNSNIEEFKIKKNEIDFFIKKINAFLVVFFHNEIFSKKKIVKFI